MDTAEQSAPITARFEEAIGRLAAFGRVLFSVAIVALGIETVLCGSYVSDSVGFGYRVIPVLPSLPSIPWLAYVIGVSLVLCGISFLAGQTMRLAAPVLGSLLFLCALILDVPRNFAHPGSMSLRTAVFEPLAIAAVACLLPGSSAVPRWLSRSSRYLLGLSLIVFGVDHLIAVVPISTLIPTWIPWHVFWVGFFGIAFIAAGLSVSFNFLGNLRRVRPRPDVWDLGPCSPSPESRWALWNSWSPAQS
jgi:uncharacterized membrane protein YphA (DoxX/SURF4 family)